MTGATGGGWGEAAARVKASGLEQIVLLAAASPIPPSGACHPSPNVLQLTLPDPVKLFKADNQLYSSTEARDPILE